MSLPYTAVHPLKDSRFLDQPLEQHIFLVDPKDDYRCAKCHRPRALHADLTPPPSEDLPPPPREGHHKRE